MLSQGYRYQKNILQSLFFCKNEACVNCDKLNATTLIWLPAAKPSVDIVAAELVAASFLSLCVDGLHSFLVRKTSWLQPRSPGAKPSVDIVAVELVAASFLGLCVDGLLKDSGANIMAAAQEPFSPAFGRHSCCGLSICVLC